MPRPAGAQNKDKPFRDALRMEIAAAQEADDKRSLRRIARTLLDKAADGDIAAIKEVADRLDGKVPQAVVGDHDEAPIQIASSMDLSKLTDEQLDALADMIRQGSVDWDQIDDPRVLKELLRREAKALGLDDDAAGLERGHG